MSRLGYVFAAVLWLVVGLLSRLVAADPLDTPALARVWSLSVVLVGAAVILVYAFVPSPRSGGLGTAVVAAVSVALTALSALAHRTYTCCAVSYHSVRGWPLTWLHASWQDAIGDDRITRVQISGLIADLTFWGSLAALAWSLIRLATRRAGAVATRRSPPNVRRSSRPTGPTTPPSEPARHPHIPEY